MGIKLKDILGIVGIAKEVIPLIKGKKKMAEPTPSDPFGQGNHDQHAYILEGIYELKGKVSALPNSREKSVMLTKLDELRHWNEDDRLRTHFENGGH